MASETSTLKFVAALAVALIAAPVASQSAIAPAETGQVVSYDVNRPRRDDGALRAGVGWPSPRFSDNGDGTMTDNLTQLVWLKQVGCLPAQNWQGALTQVASLNSGTNFGCSEYTAGAFGDWRLPNLRELESLLDASVVNHVIWLGLEGFLTVMADDYFSSTSYTATFAWTLNLPNGSPSTILKTSSRRVWPVRGTSAPPLPLPRTGQVLIFDVNLPPRDDGALLAGVAWPAPRFADPGDGTVGDGLTGLTWLADADCIASEYPGFDADGTAGDGAVTWQHALDFAAGVVDGTYPLCAAGRDDWRLPNRRELHSLVDASQNNPALPSGHPFVGVFADEYWTSTTDAVEPTFAWVVDLYTGSFTFRDKALDPRFVWLVRGGPEIFADAYEYGDLSQWSASVGGP